MLFCTSQQSKTPPKQCNTEKLPQKFNLTKYALTYVKYKAIPVVLSMLPREKQLFCPTYAYSYNGWSNLMNRSTPCHLFVGGWANHHWWAAPIRGNISRAHARGRLALHGQIEHNLFGSDFQEVIILCQQTLIQFWKHPTRHSMYLASMCIALMHLRTYVCTYVIAAHWYVYVYVRSPLIPTSNSKAVLAVRCQRQQVP